MSANTIRYSEKFHKEEADFCVTSSASKTIQAFTNSRIYP